VKGEFTVVVSKPPAPGPVAATAETIQAEVVALIRQGLPRMEAMKQVARAHGLPKRDVYRILEESYS
jgi:16S rRNA C1402 (ribose-2'-O) methylase RsmI